MLYFGNNKIKDIFFGAYRILKIYHGINKIYSRETVNPPIPPTPEPSEGNVPEFWIKDASLEWVNGHWLPNGNDGYINEVHNSTFFVTPNPMQSAYLFMPSGGGAEFIVYPAIPEIKAPENEGRQYSRNLLSQCREFETPGMDRLPFTILFENPDLEPPTPQPSGPVDKFTVTIRPESEGVLEEYAIGGTYKLYEQYGYYENEATNEIYGDPGTSSYGILVMSTGGSVGESNVINGLTESNMRNRDKISQITEFTVDGDTVYVTITF